MLALIIISSLAAYFTTGYVCTRIDIKDSLELGVTLERLESGARNAFCFWWVWLFTQGIRIGFKERVARERAQLKLLREAEVEIQKLLEA